MKTTLCYHHHLIYDAKILKAPSLDDENPAEKDHREFKAASQPEGRLPSSFGARPRSGWLWSGQVLGGFGNKCQEEEKEDAARAGNKFFISVMFFSRIARR